MKNFPWIENRKTPVSLCGNGTDTMHIVKLDNLQKIVDKEVGYALKMGYKLTN